MNPEKTGKFIAKLRKNSDLTQQQLAEKIKVSAKTISKWERGINIPDTPLLCELSNVFHVTVQELLIGEEIKDKNVSNKILINCISLYTKKTKQKFFIIVTMIIIFLISLFSIIYTLNNYNRNRIFSIESKNDSYIVKGYVIFNQNEELFILDNVIYNDVNIGTDLESVIKNYTITLRNDKIIFYSSGNIETNKNQIMSEALKTTRISFSETNDNSRIINIKDLKNIYLTISYTDVNDNVIQDKIELEINEEFANNKLFY